VPSLRSRLDTLRIRRDPLLRPDRTSRRATRGARARMFGGRTAADVQARIRPAHRSVRAAVVPARGASRRRPAGNPGRASKGTGRVLAVSELVLLAEMVEAGVRLDRALASLERASTSAAHRRTLATLRESVEAGRTLTDTIVELDVSPAVRALIAGGERIGRLGDGLRAAAELTSRLAAVRRQMRAAMAYPAIVLVVALAVLLIVSVSIVPQMERTFADLGGELPRATRIVVGVAGVIGSPWPWLVVFGAATGWRLSGRRQRGGEAGKVSGRRISQPWGPLGRQTDIAVAARIIATMLANGATAVDAFATAGGSAAHREVRHHLLELAGIAASGRPIAGTEAVRWLCPAVEQEMLAVGEERGLLAEQWERIADRRIGALERRLALLGTLAEPILVIVVGLIVGGTVTALYLPSMKVLELI